MRLHRLPSNPNMSGFVFSSGRRGAPFLPGLFLMLLAVVIIVAPKLVFGALAAMLFAFGILLCYVAYRVIKFKRQLNEMARNFERDFASQGFPMEKPDIDITDLDSKKIVYH